MTIKVFVTGAFGNVGGHVIRELCLQDYHVVAFDIQSDKTTKKHSKLTKEFDFTIEWGDLTNGEHVNSLIAKHSPDVVIHVAAIIAPTAYVIPKLAYDVNVNGTRHLIEAAQSLSKFDKFIFVSSYSVHGPRNPYTSTDRLDGNTPPNAQDNYGKHKVKGEEILQESNLPWTIIRLPAVFSVDSDFGAGPEFMKFGFLLSPDRREHAIDARDVGLALANAVNADTVGKKLNIAGGEDWKGTAAELQGALFKARGLGILPEDAHLYSDPEVDESWYFEDWVDTTESQRLLKYQRYTFQEHLDFVKNQGGFLQKVILKLFGGLIKRQLLKSSITHGKGIVRSKDPVWETVKREFEINEEDLAL